MLMRISSAIPSLRSGLPVSVRIVLIVAGLLVILNFAYRFPKVLTSVHLILERISTRPIALAGSFHGYRCGGEGQQVTAARAVFARE
jgi:hypothetical protein